MNYRHSLHAGNFADLVKHALVLWLLKERQARTDALPLPLRQDGNRPQPVPTLDLPSVVIGDRDGGQCYVTDDLPVFLGHDGER